MIQNLKDPEKNTVPEKSSLSYYEISTCISLNHLAGQTLTSEVTVAVFGMCGALTVCVN